MFVDARELNDGATLRFDVCIVGAGAAGIALALKLMGTGVDAVVLESGGEKQEATTQGLYVGRSTGQPYFDLATARLRFFGGSTNHWGGTCRPATARDFDELPGGHSTRWPIGLNDIAPYYDEAGEICGLRRSVTELDAAEREDPLSPLPLGTYDFETRYNQIVDGDRRSFATRYRDELASAGNITVHLWANVTELLTTPSGTKAIGASVATLSGVRYTIESDVVVLATGGLENPRILLSSTRARPEGLGNSHGFVGRFFMEHPRLLAAAILPTDGVGHYEWYRAHEVNEVTYQGYAAIGAHRRRADGLTDVQLRLSPQFSQAFEDAAASVEKEALEGLADWLTDGGASVRGDDLLRLTSDLTTAGDWLVPGGPLPTPLPGALGRLLAGDRREREALIPGLFGDAAAALWERGVSRPPLDRIDVIARVAQVPNPESRVTLTGETDELGVRRAALHWELSDVDRASIVRAIELFGAELAAIGAGRTRLVIDETGEWPLDTRGGWHHMGTTRMSHDASEGVVDSNCEVHDVENLFVAGSSVYPTALPATPTLTLVALALRLADHLIRDVVG